MPANPRTPPISTGRTLLGFAIAALLVLLLAGSAHADAGETGGPGVPVEEGLPTGGETTGPETPVEEIHEVVPVEETTPPVEETHEATAPPTEEVVLPAEETQETIPVGTIVEESSKTIGSVSDASPLEGSSEVALLPVATNTGTSTTTAAATGVLAATAELPPPTTTAAGEAWAPVALTEAALGKGAAAAAAAVAATTGSGCDLGALGSPSTDNCAPGWLTSSTYLAETPSRLADAVAVLPINGQGGPPSPGNGGAPLGDHSNNGSAPGPAPGGAGGGGAPGGGSGPPPSAFLSLAGLLLLAAPRALRRLRLSARPYLTAFFVLIPERPG